MSFFILIFAPYGIAWRSTRNRWRGYRWLSILALVLIQLFSLLPVAVMVLAIGTEPKQETSVMLAGVLPYRTNESPAPLNEMHSRGGEWSGRDYVRACGTAIVAPFDGIVTRGGVGAVDSWNNTYMYIKSSDGRYEMLIMHSDYFLSTGDRFSKGQELGKTNTIGYSSECHEHISLKVDGVIVDPENYRITTQNGKPLKISWYDPLLGGVNCDHDCSTMATGTKVTEDRYGRTAACIRDWTGKTVVIPELGTFECLDRGGAIVEHSEYIWIDLLLHEPLVPFGSLVYEYEVR